MVPILYKTLGNAKKETDGRRKMYLRVKGGPFTRNMFLEIQTITDHSILPCDSVKYDRENRLVTMQMIDAIHSRLPKVRFLEFSGSKRGDENPVGN